MWNKWSYNVHKNKYSVTIINDFTYFVTVYLSEIKSDMTRLQSMNKGGWVLAAYWQEKVSYDLSANRHQSIISLTQLQFMTVYSICWDTFLSVPANIVNFIYCHTFNMFDKEKACQMLHKQPRDIVFCVY